MLCIHFASCLTAACLISKTAASHVVSVCWAVAVIQVSALLEAVLWCACAGIWSGAQVWLTVLGFHFAGVCSASLLVRSICGDRVCIQCLVASYWLPAAAMYEA